MTLIGANGAGKSTTLRSINGLNQPREGSIHFQGDDITKRRAHEIVKHGISQSPEGRRVFPRHDACSRTSRWAPSSAKRPPGDQRGHGPRVRRSSRASPSARARRRGRSPAASSRCARSAARLMARPKLLLLDEPSMGLAPIFVERIFETHRDDQRAGHVDPARRAERADGARGGQPRLRARDRPRRARRRREVASRERAGPQDLPRRGALRRHRRRRPRRRSGKYGGESRKPIRASAPDAARHLRARRPTPADGDEAELPRGRRVAAAGDEDGCRAGSAHGVAGAPVEERHERVHACARRGTRRAPRGSAAAARSASPTASGRVRCAGRRRARGTAAASGAAKRRWKSCSRIAVPPSATGNVVAPQPQRQPEPEVGGEQRVRALAGKERRRRRDADHDRVERLVERGARDSIARSSASACATDGGPPNGRGRASSRRHALDDAAPQPVRHEREPAAQARGRDPLEDLLRSYG